MHEFWHTETTFWLRELDVGYECLPDYYGGERRPDLSGQRQPTWPPFRPPKEGAGVMLRRKYEPGEDPPDVDSHINALLEQARRERVHRQTANLSRAAVKRTTVAVDVQGKCPPKRSAKMSHVYSGMVSDGRVAGVARDRRVGGLSASMYLLAVSLWMPNSLATPRMDGPLSLTRCIAFQRSFCRNVGFRGDAVTCSSATTISSMEAL